MVVEECSHAIFIASAAAEAEKEYARRTSSIHQSSKHPVSAHVFGAAVSSVDSMYFGSALVMTSRAPRLDRLCRMSASIDWKVSKQL